MLEESDSYDRRVTARRDGLVCNSTVFSLQNGEAIREPLQPVPADRHEMGSNQQKEAVSPRDAPMLMR
jgi:hypothetical protein